MKKSYWIILFIWAALFGTAVYVSAQELYLKISEVPSNRIYKGVVNYDTLEKGQGVVYRLLITDEGLRDTTKQIIIKYEAFQIDAGTPPVTQVDTVDSEGLTFSTDWQRKGLPLRTGWYKGTIAYSNVGQVSYKFIGTRLQIYGETKPTDGTGSIVIGSKTATIFYNKPQALQTLVYDSGVMPSGEYTFVLRPLSGSINVDFIVVHK